MQSGCWPHKFALCVGCVHRTYGGGGHCVRLRQEQLIAQLRAFADGAWSPPLDAVSGEPAIRVRPAGSDFRAGGIHTSASFWQAALRVAGCSKEQKDLLTGVVSGGLHLMQFFQKPSESEVFTGGLQRMRPPNPRSHIEHQRLIPQMKFAARPLDPLPAHLGEAGAVLREKVAELVAVGAAVKCPPGVTPWVVSPLSLAVNGAGNKVRLIHDLRGLNSYLQPFTFSFPTLREWAKGIDEGDLLVGIDWQSAYHAILLDEESQQLCGFELDGQYYVMRALPFGLNIAPALFQLSTEVFHAFLREHGCVRSMGFIDDSAANAGAKHGQSAEERGRAVGWFLCQASFCAGHTVAVLKSQLQPKPRMRHLGLWVDAGARTFEVPAEKLARFSALLQTLQVSGVAQVRELQRLAGWLVSFTAAIPCALVFLREIFHLVAGGLRSGQRAVSVASAVAQSALEALSDVELWSGAFPWPSDSHLQVHVVATDASCTGLAGALVVATPPFRLEPLLFRYRRGLTEVEGDEHIMINEAKAVKEAVTEFQGRLAGNHVRFLIDNESAQAALAGAGSKNLALNEVVKDVWRDFIKLAIRPTFDRISSEDNVLADEDSREEMGENETWRASGLAPKAHLLLSLKYPRFVPVWQRPASEMRLHHRKVKQALAYAEASGGISLDLFASHESAVVPRFVGLLNEPSGPREQVAVDAFSFCPAEGERVFCNPPWHLFAAVRNHLRTVRAVGVWVFPEDPKALWYPAVREASRHVIVLARAGEDRTFLSGNRSLRAGHCPLLIAEFDFSSTPC